MIAGIILNENEEEYQVAFLGDKTEAFNIEETEKLVEKLKEKDLDVVAVDAGKEYSKENLTDQEEELKEEGYTFMPSGAQKKKTKHFQTLKAVVRRDMMEPPEFISFNPFITAEELALDGDSALESLGVSTADINSSKQFDAVLGAVTARFYDQGHYKDLGVIVPEKLDE